MLSSLPVSLTANTIAQRAQVGDPPRRCTRGAQVARSCQKVTRPALSEDTSGVPCGLQAVHSTLAAPASFSVRTTAPARSACCTPARPRHASG